MSTSTGEREGEGTTAAGGEGPSRPAPASLRGAFAAPERVGPFRILRVLGTGGMGSVYEALQENPQRTVALKLIRPEALGPETLRRFAREADLLARLTHEGIAQVYAAGTFSIDGAELPYFAMEFVPSARTLTEYARERELDLAARLRLFTRVCDAVEYGHRRGVIHRDLKPDNILVDGSSDASRPKVIDFGVARPVDPELAGGTLHTSVGQLVGTLHYMSPEQVQGDPSKIDHRTDVYSLGVVLYELITDRMPYELRGVPLLEVARLIREEPVRRLSTVHRGLSAELDTITLKALEKDRARRYPTVAELASDVRAFLRGDPISARPASAVYRLRKFAQRNRGLFASLMALATVLVVATVVSLRWAVLAQARAEQIERELTHSKLNSAADALAGNRPELARELLTSVPPDLRGWEWRHLESRLDPSLGSPLGPEWRSPFLAFSPEGARLAIRVGDGADARQVVFDADSREVLLDVPVIPSQGAFTPDGRALLLATLSPGVQRVDLTTGEVLPLVPVAFDPHGGEFSASPATGRYAIQTASGVEVRDLADDRLLRALPGGRAHVAFSADGRVLARGDGARLSILDGEILEPLLPDHDVTDVNGVNALAFHPRRRLLAVGSAYRDVHLVDLEGGEPRRGLVLRGMNGAVTRIAWSADGALLAAGSDLGEGRVWDVATAETRTVLGRHQGWVTTLAFKPGTGELVSCDSTGEMQTWLGARASTDVLRGHSSYVNPVAVSPDGAELVSGSWDGLMGAPGGLKLWDARSSALVASHGSEREVFLSAAFSRDGRRVLASVWDVSSQESVVRVLDARTWRERMRFQGHGKERVVRVVPHPDGRRVLSVGTVTEALFWELDTGEVLARFDLDLEGDPFGEGSGAALSPDGRWIAMANGATSIALHDADSFERLRSWPAHEWGIWSLDFSPDGRWLVSASADDTIAVWEAATGALVTRLEGHGEDVLSVAVSPDGARIASGGRDGYVRIWDTRHWEQVVRLAGHGDYVYSLAWGPDGEWLVSGSGDSTVRIWDATTLAERDAESRRREALVRELEPLVARAFGGAVDPDAAFARLDRELSGRAREVAGQIALANAQRFASAGPGDPIAPEHYLAPRCEGAAPVIDGRLDDEAWSAAPWTRAFVDIQGAGLPAPRQRTRAKLLWDDAHLYVAAWLDEEHVWGTLTARDSIIYRDNDFELFLDPDGDSALYYELELNALGTVFDLMLDKPYHQGGGARIGWDVEGLRHAVHVEGTLGDPSDLDQGWSVELAIPFEVFREHSAVALPPAVGDTWRLNFSRVEWRHELLDGAYRKVPDTLEDNWVWSPQHVIDMHRPERWGFLEFGAPAR